MGVCCARTARPHVASALFFDVDRRCVFGGVSPPLRGRLPLSCLLESLRTSLRTCRRNLRARDISTSFATSAARPWSNGGTMHICSVSTAHRKDDKQLCVLTFQISQRKAVWSSNNSSAQRRTIRTFFELRNRGCLGFGAGSTFSFPPSWPIPH